MFSWFQPKKMAAKGVLGMNRRNIHYIGEYNQRKLYPLVDNKLETKLLAEKFQISTPKLIAVLKNQSEVKNIAELVKNHQGFAIKPARGSGGKGILIIKGREDEMFVRSSDKLMDLEDLQRHLTNIIAGLYSLAGQPDTVIIEELVETDPVFAPYSFQGVPDIRIIVFQGFPVMAMLRLSTRQSDGKANLHQGAVGVGINMASGKAAHAVQFDQALRQHPDTKQSLDQIEIPGWQNLLEIAASAYEMTGLGYLGVDIVLDKHQGPMLLELNARPGLSIQLANGVGLIHRLETIEKLQPDLVVAADRVSFSQQNFG